MTAVAGGRFAGTRRYWLLTSVYLVVLFGMQPWLGVAVDVFKERWSAEALDVTVDIIVGLSGLMLITFLAGLLRVASRAEGASLLLSLAIYLGGAYHTTVPQERLHYIEYGLLAVLLYVGFASTPRVRGMLGLAKGDDGWQRLAALTFAVGAGFGYLDELLQILWERRYFDWLDVRLNAGATLLGLMIAVPVVRIWRLGRQ